MRRFYILRIVGYKLQDIQSWDEKSPSINLSTDRMNVIIAPSETGKSVIIKILKEMCFSGKWGYTWESLIRRDKKRGVAMFMLEDGTVIAYFIYPRAVRYSIIYGDKEKPNKTWDFFDPNNTEIPEEVANLMGLVVDRKGKTIINVLDKDMVIPYVTASPELNARISSVITTVPEMEKRREMLSEWKQRLETAYKNADRKLADARYRYERAPSVDVLSHKLALMRAEALLNFVKPIDDILNYTVVYPLGVEPEPVYCPDLAGTIDVLHQIERLFEEYSGAMSLSEPSIVNKPNEEVADIISLSDDINTLINLLEDMESLEEPIEPIVPVVVGDIIDIEKNIIKVAMEIKGAISIGEGLCEVKKPSKDISDIIRINNNISKLMFIYNNAISLQCPQEIIVPPDMVQIYNILQDINAMQCDEVLSLYEDSIVLQKDIDNVEYELNELRVKMKICPLCGKPWEM